MKVSDIAKKYGLDTYALEDFIQKSGRFKYKMGLLSMNLDDSVDPEAVVRAYHDRDRQAQLLRQQEEEENRRKQQAMSQMLITSGFNFDGYTIVKYSGYISGDDAIQVDRGHEGIFSSATNVGDALMASLSQIRRNAIAELKEAAYELGCNAVIGVDFDYLTLEPETANFNGGTTYLPYVFGVTANGNAVIIRKNEEPPAGRVGRHAAGGQQPDMPRYLTPEEEAGM